MCEKKSFRKHFLIKDYLWIFSSFLFLEKGGIYLHPTKTKLFPALVSGVVLFREEPVCFYGLPSCLATVGT